MTISADNGRYLTHANLSHINALMQLMGQVSYQLAEVNSLIGREVTHDLLAIKEIFHSHRLHIKIFFSGKATKYGESVISHLSKLFRTFKILKRGHAEHRFKLGIPNGICEFVVRDIANIIDNESNLLSSFRLANNVIALLRA